jgi:hypothetical protein
MGGLVLIQIFNAAPLSVLLGCCITPLRGIERFGLMEEQ